LVGVGLAASYGVLAFQGFLFLLPRRGQPKTRRIFAGRVDQFEMGGIMAFSDLEGNEILVRRKSEGDFQAFSSTCPHLGCKVHWQEEEQRYFCPCHRGVFDPDGEPVSGPPADGKQRLSSIPLEVDEAAGVLYLQVKDPGRRSS
jgi:Rieske Fe-S protein